MEFLVTLLQLLVLAFVWGVSYLSVNHLIALLMLRLMGRYPDWSDWEVRVISTAVVCTGWVLGVGWLVFVVRLL